MHGEFVTFEQALALKGLGLDERSFCYYDMDGTLWQMGIPMTPNYEPMFGLFNPRLNPDLVCAPTYQQAFSWLRKKNKVHGEVMLIKGNSYTWECYKISDEPQIGVSRLTAHESMSSNQFDSYEEAESVCLDKLIELLKDNK